MPKANLENLIKSRIECLGHDLNAEVVMLKINTSSLECNHDKVPSLSLYK